MTIAQRLAIVRRRIEVACLAAGRSADEVGLVAVTKTFPAAAIREAYAGGQRDFGENYAQELRDKGRELNDLELRWHFIGRLQRNKAKYVGPLAWRVHSIESVAEAEALAHHAVRPVTMLLAVNLAGEATKGGVEPNQALAICESLMRVPGVKLRGLMALPPYRDDPDDVAPFFAELADLAARGRARGLPLVELSMGMSHDFDVAIRHGATWVRIGSAIFGSRTG